MRQVQNSQRDKVFSFVRQDENSKILVLLNFSDTSVDVRCLAGPFEGRYRRYAILPSEAGDGISELQGDVDIPLPPWGFAIYVSR